MTVVPYTHYHHHRTRITRERQEAFMSSNHIDIYGMHRQESSHAIYNKKQKATPSQTHIKLPTPTPQCLVRRRGKKSKKTVIAQTRHGTTTEKANTSKLHLKNRQDNSGSQNKNHVKTSPPLYTICQTMPCHAMLCHARRFSTC